MAEITQDRVTTVTDECVRARIRLAGAFARRDRARQRYEAAIGTSTELGAYVRLRQAGEHVSACDKWLRWVESEDFLRAPRSKPGALDELVAF
jgi:hypothetical protein